MNRLALWIQRQTAEWRDPNRVALVAAIGGGVLLGEFYSVARFSDPKITYLYYFVKEWQTLFAGGFAVLAALIAIGPVNRQLSEIRFQSGAMRYDMHRVQIQDLDAELNAAESVKENLDTLKRRLKNHQFELRNGMAPTDFPANAQGIPESIRTVINTLKRSDKATEYAGRTINQDTGMDSSLGSVIKSLHDISWITISIVTGQQTIETAMPAIEIATSKALYAIDRILAFVEGWAGEVSLEANLLRSERRDIFTATTKR